MRVALPDNRGVGLPQTTFSAVARCRGPRTPNETLSTSCDNHAPHAPVREMSGSSHAGVIKTGVIKKPPELSISSWDVSIGEPVCFVDGGRCLPFSHRPRVPSGMVGSMRLPHTQLPPRTVGAGRGFDARHLLVDELLRHVDQPHRVQLHLDRLAEHRVHGRLLPYSDAKVANRKC
jgi:hypothetical protein